jgi:hypothetical protein
MDAAYTIPLRIRLGRAVLRPSIRLLLHLFSPLRSPPRQCPARGAV